MSVGPIMLVAILTAPMLAALYPRPGQLEYSVAKAFVAIARRDDELNMRALDGAFGLSKFDRGFRWLGPYKEIGKGQSYAFYDPQNSPLGITKIAIEWKNDKAVVLGSGKKDIPKV